LTQATIKSNMIALEKTSE